MKNLNLTFVAIIFALFALTSCEKEGMSEINQTTATEMTERDLPEGGINIVNDDVKTAASRASLADQAQSRARAFYMIEDISRPIYGDNAGQGNSHDKYDSPCAINSGSLFNGEDVFYVFEVPSVQIADADEIYEITLSDLEDDLDIFVYTMPYVGYIKDCRGASLNSNTKNETVKMTNPNAGLYLIVVDGYKRSKSSSFTLNINKTVKPIILDPGGETSEKEITISNMSGVSYGDHSNPVFINKVTGGWKVDKDGSSIIYKEKLRTATTLTLESIGMVGVIGRTTTYINSITIDLGNYKVFGSDKEITETAIETERGTEIEVSEINGQWFDYIIEAY